LSFEIGLSGDYQAARNAFLTAAETVRSQKILLEAIGEIAACDLTQ
jgi:hypothetical protein